MRSDFEILVPIWNYKGNRCVGLAIDKIPERDFITVDIVYKNKAGVRIYPDQYRVKHSYVMNAERKVLNGGRVLAVIPINAMEIV